MLKGKTAIVTGSTSGIGMGIAHALAAQGAQVMINGFGDAAAIEKERAGIADKYKVKVAYSSADVTHHGEVQAMIEQAEKELGPVDILVNNAGIQFVEDIEKFPTEKWDAVLGTNLDSAFYSVRAALPGMKQRKWGRIINIASAHGLVASARKSAYVASKHGIVGLTKVIALETAQSGITCNAICPGWVLTPLVQKQIEDRAKAENISTDKAKHDLLAEKQPTLQFVEIAEIGALVVYLCGDMAKSITGAAISIDGGWTAE